jgi:acyl-CoA synthetase (AMP-forming)/AMP-acid ligase II/acyl carrier protein
VSAGGDDTEPTIITRFVSQAARRPDATAIQGEPTLSYGELSARARAVADRLSSGDRAVLLTAQTGAQVAAALGALASGVTLVTLNPADPPGRHTDIVATVGPDVVLTDVAHHDRARSLLAPDAQIVVVDDPALAVDPARASLLSDDGPAPADLAVLVCTSGSTGRPKAVMHTHANLLDNVRRYRAGVPLEETDRVAWLASLSGGQGLVTVLSTLLSGAALCPFSVADRGLTGLTDWLDAELVTVFDTIPSVLRSLAKTARGGRCRTVRQVRLASEGATGADHELFTRVFSADCALVSVLASSEAGVIAQGRLFAGERPGPGPLSVGAPAPGVQLTLLDGAGAPAGEGETGEIVVAHPHLALGYLDDPELSAQKFETVDGGRRLRSGDLGRFGPDGGLRVVGRVDRQVKVRGLLVQPEEVERVLLDDPTVSSSAVLVAHGAQGQARLTAHVAGVGGRRPSPAAVRGRAAGRLPAQAVPAEIIVHDELPLTATGKVDRTRIAALAPAHEPAIAPLPEPPVAPLPEPVAVAPAPEPVAVAPAPDPPAPPSVPAPEEVEAVLVELFAETLERPVDLHDAFLDLGVDSLSAAEIAAGVAARFGVELDLRTFASNLSAAGVAALVRRRLASGEGSDLPPLRRIERTSPLSQAQLRMWSATELDGSDPRWHVVVPFALRGPLDLDALREAVAQVVARHEILRTTFTEQRGEPLAVVAPALEIPVVHRDLRGEADPRAVADRAVAQELTVPFDLRHGPLLRLVVLQLGEDEYRLLRCSHHLVHDALSWRTFFDELAAAYAARSAGRPSPLTSPPALQYADYVHWEREWLRPGGPRWESDIAYWRRRLAPPVAPLRLSFARPEPLEGPVAHSGVLRWGFDAHVARGLDELGREEGATHFMTRLAVFAALLALEGDVRELVVGTPISTRVRAELQNMIGPFLNFAILRMAPAPSASFREWVSEVRRAVVDAGAHATVPWESVMSALRAEKVTIPAVTTRFVAWSALAPMRLGELELEPLPRECAEPSGFRLGVNRSFEAERCWAEFDPRIHDPELVAAFLDRLQTLGAVLAADPDRALGDLHAAVQLA